jgi:hypothetical protein
MKLNAANVQGKAKEEGRNVYDCQPSVEQLRQLQKLHKPGQPMRQP